MPKFGAGVVKFEREIYPENEGLFALLSEGQSPEAMFITCSDSRIELGMLTQSKPGDLFVVRNAGNIVPPHDNKTGATTAAIEFAVGVLRVPHIVICGHTDCGAVKGALTPEKLDALPHLREWLGFMRAAVEIVAATSEGMDEQARNMYLLEQNVLLQLAHLKTHPTVAVAMAKGEIKLHGWVYNIRTGQVVAFNEDTGRFEDVEQRYAVQVKKHFDEFHPHS